MTEAEALQFVGQLFGAWVLGYERARMRAAAGAAFAPGLVIL
jgi:hypothetical protein